MSHLAIVLAAGLGTRMKSELPKVAHIVAGRPIIHWVLDAVLATSPIRTIVVLGHGAEVVEGLLPDEVEICIQPDQLGTGHAVQVALDSLDEIWSEPVMIVPGDTPLISGEALQRLVDLHQSSAVGAAILTAVAVDPTGYGRIVRTADGAVSRIVEERDADESIRAIDEINAGMYMVDGHLLTDRVAALEVGNVQGELYLTDIVGETVAAGSRVEALVVEEDIVAGVNSQSQLALVARLVRQRLAEGLMADGVRIIDPDRLYIDVGVTVEKGAVIHPNVHLTGRTSIESGAEIGPDVFVADSVIGPGSRVWFSVVRGARVGADCEVGPFASLRPGTVMSDGSKVGTFAETKNVTLGHSTKVPHLSYIGDATIGDRVNVGAGTITCNYDGHEKHHTRIDDDAFIGSDTMLVAPVTIGEGAITGAGSTITKDVQAGDLAVERSEQKAVRGYAERRAARYRAARTEEDH